MSEEFTYTISEHDAVGVEQALGFLLDRRRASVDMRTFSCVLADIKNMRDWRSARGEASGNAKVMYPDSTEAFVLTEDGTILTKKVVMLVPLSKAQIDCSSQERRCNIASQVERQAVEHGADMVFLMQVDGVPTSQVGL